MEISANNESCLHNLKGIDWLRRSSLLSSECIDKYFVEGKFSDMACFLSVLSSLFGYCITLSSGLIKLPQIITIWAQKNADGVSAFSEILILCSIFGNLANGFQNNLPLPLYGDSYFLFFHTLLVILLILRYNDQQYMSYQPYLSWSVFLLSITSIGLLFTNKLPIIIIQLFIKCSMLCAVVSRLWQLVLNWYNQSTGQLSTLTTILLLMVSISRIFTSVQEANQIAAWMFAIISVLNLALLYQLGYYWSYAIKTVEEDHHLKDD